MALEEFARSLGVDAHEICQMHRRIYTRCLRVKMISKQSGC